MRVDAERFPRFRQIKLAGARRSLSGWAARAGGQPGRAYFGVLDRLILNDKGIFSFNGRSRRPPLDPVNAMLSFAYNMLAHGCASALEAAGLDPYVGFFTGDRPGRTSTALDLMEELRPCQRTGSLSP